MKRWLCAAACGLWLWAGGIAQAEDIHLSGGMVWPMEDVTSAPVESSFLGSLLAGRVRDAVREDSLRGTIDSLGFFDRADTARRDRLARVAARVLAGARLDLLTAADGQAAGLFLSVHVSDANRAELAALMKGARDPHIPMAREGSKPRRRSSSIRAGDFALVEATPVRRGTSSHGVPFRWGGAELAFTGQWRLVLPFTAVYAVQEAQDGEVYTLFLAMPEGAAYFGPRLAEGLAGAWEGTAPDRGEEES